MRIELTIRKLQLQALQQCGSVKFQEWMEVHLKKHFPEQCADMKDSALRALIDYGIARAESYQIVTQTEVCKYIDMMMVFGKDFDTDSAMPWANAILRKADLSGRARMQQLMIAVIQHSAEEPLTMEDQ